MEKEALRPQLFKERDLGGKCERLSLLCSRPPILGGFGAGSTLGLFTCIGRHAGKTHGRLTCPPSGEAGTTV